MHKMTFLVLFSVTTCSYLSCRYIARQRSTLIAVTVNKVTAVKKTDMKVRAFDSVQEVILPESLKSTALNPTLSSGSDISPIHRSDKARPNINVFVEQCKFGIRIILIENQQISNGGSHRGKSVKNHQCDQDFWFDD